MDIILTDGLHCFGRQTVTGQQDLDVFNASFTTALEWQGRKLNWCEAIGEIDSLPWASLQARARVLYRVQEVTAQFQENQRRQEERQRHHQALRRLLTSVLGETVPASKVAATELGVEPSPTQEIETISAELKDSKIGSKPGNQLDDGETAEIDGLLLRAHRRPDGYVLVVGVVCPSCTEPQWIVISRIEDLGQLLEKDPTHSLPCPTCQKIHALEDDPFAGE